MTATDIIRALGGDPASGKARCPAHDDKNPSLSIKVEGGKPLVHCFAGCAQDSVIAALRARGLWPTTSNGSSAPRASAPGTPAKPGKVAKLDRAEWTPIVPVPAGVAMPTFNHFKLGDASAHWAYRDASGALLGFVCRFDFPEGGKDVMPLTYCERDGRKDWQWKAFPKPRPLYGLPDLAARPNDYVLIVEGEKSADAARQLVPGAVCVTWPGGSSATAMADWSPLKGRMVAIWPDWDRQVHKPPSPHAGALKHPREQPGIKAALSIYEHLSAAGAGAVRVIAWPEGPIPPETVKDGWDAADALAEGWSQDRAIAWIQDNARDPTGLYPALEGEPEPPARPEPPIQDDPGDASGGLPTIRIVNGELPRTVTEAEAALMSFPSHGGIYQRASMLVRVIAAPEIVRGIRREKGAPIISAIQQPTLLEKFAECATWVKWDGRKSKWVRRDVPEMVAKAYAARGEWVLPVLSGIVSAPTLRADGTVLQAPGYDAATGLLFNTDYEWPAVAESPDREDALEAADSLAKPFSLFPFFDPVADLAVLLAAILTGLIRPSLPAAPLFAFDAPSPGSGKSLLCDCVSLIATGRNAPRATWGSDAVENQKKLTAALIAGDAVLLMDNVSAPIEGDALCAILTGEEYRDRILGLSKLVTVPTSALLLASGNNLAVHGDMTTRALMCRLDAKVEKPEERPFPGDIRKEIRERRGELVRAGLTIMRAFIVAGSPRQAVLPLGRFEAWSRIVRESLVWIGQGDPCKTRDRITRMDESALHLEAMLSAWEMQFKGDAETVSAAVRLVAPDQPGKPDSLRDAILDVAADRSGGISQHRLGRWFRRMEGRPIGKRRFQRGEPKGTRQTWLVETMA